DAGSGGHFAHDVVQGIADIKVALSIHHDGGGITEFSGSGGTTVPAITETSRTRDGRNDAGPDIHLAHDVVTAIDHVEIALGIHAHAFVAIQSGRGGGPAVARISRRARSGGS